MIELLQKLEIHRQGKWDGARYDIGRKELETLKNIVLFHWGLLATDEMEDWHYIGNALWVELYFTDK